MTCDCTDDDAKGCGDKYFPYVCTRPKGHDGDHRACGSSEHSFREWNETSWRDSAATVRSRLTGEKKA